MPHSHRPKKNEIIYQGSGVAPATDLLQGLDHHLLFMWFFQYFSLGTVPNQNIVKTLSIVLPDGVGQPTAM